MTNSAETFSIPDFNNADSLRPVAEGFIEFADSKMATKSLAERAKKPVQDVMFPENLPHKFLEAIGKPKIWNDPAVWKFLSPMYLSFESALAHGVSPEGWMQIAHNRMIDDAYDALSPAGIKLTEWYIEYLRDVIASRQPSVGSAGSIDISAARHAARRNFTHLDQLVD